ncbi:MAG TPA: UvrD-helicase domain-containing protein, partial [Gemmatimonadaceae bacterium]|nr:UvrD-helicase domain-containing protein [Gemmatimonadaceae bacterium]
MTPHAHAPFRALDVALDPGITLVEASAGTGKTFAITRLLLRLLLERKVESLSRILVVTFTEKATQELVTRIRTTLREAERVWSDAPPAPTSRNADLFALRERHGAEGRAILADAMRSLDDLAVFTIHGFCHRVLGESALESRIPFRTTFIEDDSEPFGRSARDWARKRLINSPDD